MHRYNWPISSKTATEVILRLIASGAPVRLGACLIESLPGCLSGSDTFGYTEIITSGTDREAAQVALKWVEARHATHSIQQSALLEVA